MKTSQAKDMQRKNGKHCPELQNITHDGVAVYSAIDEGQDFIFCEHNPAGERITGLLQTQVVGRRVTEVFPGIGTLGLLDVLRRVYKTGRSEQHPVNHYEDERIVLWVENSVFKLPSGKIVAVYRDITDRKQAEEALVHLSLLRDTMLAVHRQLAKPQKIENLIQKICTIFVEKKGYKSSWIALLDKKQCCTFSGNSGVLQAFHLLQHKMGQGHLPPCIRQVLERKMLVCYTSQQQICSSCIISNGHPDAGVMVAPIVYEERVYGVVTVFLDKQLVHNSEERMLLEKMAADIAFALYNREQDRKRLLVEREIRIRDKISRTFIIHQDNDLFGGVLDIVLDAMESRFGVFGYLDGPDMLVCPSMTTAMWEQCEMDDTTIYFPEEKWTGIWREALQTGKTQCVNRSCTVPKGHAPIDTSVATAIVSGSQVIGLLQVANKTDGYDEQDEKLLESIATTIAPILQARLAQQSTEKKLKGALQEYTNLYNNVPDMLVSVDAETGNVIQCNQTLIDKLGYTRSEIIGHPALDFYHPDCLEKGKKKIIPTLENMGRVMGRELILQKKDGSRLFVSVDISAVRDDENNIIQSSSVIHDITERKMMEEQLLISEKMTTIAGLAAGVAHEINTPLSGILQSIQLIEMGFDPVREENQQLAVECGVNLFKIQDYLRKKDLTYFLNGVRNSADTAAHIIADLLQFSRPQENDMALVSLTELIDRSIELAKTDYSLKKEYNIINVDFIRHDSTENLKLYCVAMELEQVFINLIKNSCQAMIEKKGFRDPQIILNTKKCGGMVVIEVIDNGPGMDEGTSLQVFDPFYTTKEVGKGTGLGLSVAYSIINEKHGGSIRVEKTSPEGTQFTIELPMESTGYSAYRSAHA